MLKVVTIIAVILLPACNTNKLSKDDSSKNMVETVDEGSEEYRLSCEYSAFDTTIEVVFNDTRDRISECQKKNYDNFISRQELLTPGILAAIFEYYKEVYPDYYQGWSSVGRLTEKQIEENLPTPTTPENLKKYIKPLAVYIANKEECEDGTIGIYFECTWDIKNDLGVVIKKWKVVDVGTGDIAFLF